VGRQSGRQHAIIDAAIHDAVMALPPDERRDRARRLGRTIKDGAQIA
jgi:hypothetical protein